MSGTPGNGVKAYMRVYLWFAGTTGLALQEKMMYLMRPVQTTNEHEIADALEKWSEQERTMKMHGTDYELGAACKITALRTIMNCRREQFEKWSERLEQRMEVSWDRTCLRRCMRRPESTPSRGT